MTYNVSSGTLNSTILYHLRNNEISCRVHDSVFCNNQLPERGAPEPRSPWHSAIVPPTKDGPAHTEINTLIHTYSWFTNHAKVHRTHTHNRYQLVTVDYINMTDNL